MFCVSQITCLCTGSDKCNPMSRRKKEEVRNGFHFSRSPSVHGCKGETRQAAVYCVQEKLYSAAFFLHFFCPRCWIPCFLLRYRRLSGSRNKTSCDGSLLLGNGEMSSLNGERLRSEREGRMGFDVLHGVFLGRGQHAFNTLCLYTSSLMAEIHFRSSFAKVFISWTRAWLSAVLGSLGCDSSLLVFFDWLDLVNWTILPGSPLPAVRILAGLCEGTYTVEIKQGISQSRVRACDLVTVQCERSQFILVCCAVFLWKSVESRVVSLPKLK